MSQCQVIEFKDKRAINESHQLHNIWHWIIKNYTASQMVCERWLDFWNFVEDIKEKPGHNFRFYRRNFNKPYGPDNFRWREFVNSDERRKKRATYARKYRARKLEEDPGFHKHWALKRQYGIGIKEYNEMVAKQKGVCAICEGTEKSVSSNSDRTRTLNVDHCHATGSIRGLLCSRCNRALGFFGDSVVSLKKAIEYLGGNLK